MCQQKHKGVVDWGLGWKKLGLSLDSVCSIPILSKLQNILHFCETGCSIPFLIKSNKETHSKGKKENNNIFKHLLFTQIFLCIIKQNKYWYYTYIVITMHCCHTVYKGTSFQFWRYAGSVLVQLWGYGGWREQHALECTQRQLWLLARVLFLCFCILTQNIYWSLS